MTLKTIAKLNKVKPSTLIRQYKNHSSGYSTRDQRPHVLRWLVFPQTMGPFLCIDELRSTSRHANQLRSVFSLHSRYLASRAMDEWIKDTRANQRGVRDISLFLFRLTKLYAKSPEKSFDPIFSSLSKGRFNPLGGQYHPNVVSYTGTCMRRLIEKNMKVEDYFLVIYWRLDNLRA